jgi:penicillin-binding protein 2
LLKRTAILAIAILSSWGAASNLARPAPVTIDSSHVKSRVTSTRKAKIKKTRRRSTRRRSVRRRYWSPWHVSSYGHSGADDNPDADDPQVRAAALQALGRWNGSVLVVDPNTGRILTLVNQKLALESGFTPCSTFKPVVALGALKEGVITPDTELYVGRRTHMDLTEALAHSNNLFFARLGERLGYARVAQYAHEFGLGQKAGWDIPGESSGEFPSQPPRDGGVGMMTSFGSGLEVTPLQMAAIASALANGGTLYYLQYPQTPQEVENFRPRVKRHLQDLSQYFPYVRQGMAAAVLYGTARLAYDPEEQIFGKTGTCSEDGARLGWFVSYANGQQAKYVVVILLRGGRPMFGPHAAEIAGRLYRELRLQDQNAERAENRSLPGISMTR